MDKAGYTFVVVECALRYWGERWLDWICISMTEVRTSVSTVHAGEI